MANPLRSRKCGRRKPRASRQGHGGQGEVGSSQRIIRLHDIHAKWQRRGGFCLDDRQISEANRRGTQRGGSMKKTRKRNRKCRMCGHSMSNHVLNVADQVCCTVDGCHLWMYCGRKEKKLNGEEA